MRVSPDPPEVKGSEFGQSQTAKLSLKSLKPSDSIKRPSEPKKLLPLWVEKLFDIKNN